MLYLLVSRSHRGWRDVDSLYSWAFEHLPSLVTKLNHESFMNKVLDSEEAWVIDFYAPWCGHCIQFSPHFEKVAKVSRLNEAMLREYRKPLADAPDVLTILTPMH